MLYNLLNFQKHLSRGVLSKRWSENIQQIYRRKPMLKCDFNKVAKQLYWNYTSARVLSCKFSEHLFIEHLWMAAPEFSQCLFLVFSCHEESSRFPTIYTELNVTQVKVVSTPLIPVETGRKFNVYKTLSSERLMYAQFTSCVYGDSTTFSYIICCATKMLIYKFFWDYY